MWLKRPPGWSIHTCSERWLVHPYLQWTVIGPSIPVVHGDWSLHTCSDWWLVHPYLQWTVIGQSIPAVNGDWSLHTCSERWLVHPYLQWTVIGPSWPNCSLVLWTCPMKSMNPSPDLGTPCSGQSVKWNWRIVRDWPSRASVTWTIIRSIYRCPSMDIILNWQHTPFLTHFKSPSKTGTFHISVPIYVYYTGLAAYSCPFTYRCPPTHTRHTKSHKNSQHLCVCACVSVCECVWVYVLSKCSTLQMTGMERDEAKERRG